MKDPATVERARAYLDADFAQSGRKPQSYLGSSEGPFVTISREAGSGGSSLAIALAERLNHARQADERMWATFDQQLIERVLADEHLPTRLARFVPEDRISEIDSSVGEIVGLHPNLWTIVQKTNEFMRALARKGSVIFVGRGAHLATAGIQHGLHVRLIASLEERARRMAARLRIPIAQAAAENKQTDAARRAYVRSVFNADVADPTAYDFVVNTARLSIDATADLVAAQLQKIRARTVGV